MGTLFVDLGCRATTSSMRLKSLLRGNRGNSPNQSLVDSRPNTPGPPGSLADIVIVYEDTPALVPRPNSFEVRIH